MIIRNPKDFWSGVLFVVVGTIAVVVARGYPMGSALKMGPAYFPSLLGAMLALVGAATMVRGLVRDGDAIGRFAWRDLLLILAATVVFGTLIRGAGLVPAVVTLVIMGAYASSRFHWRYALLLAAGLAALCVLLFVTALGMPIRAFGPWLGQ